MLAVWGLFVVEIGAPQQSPERERDQAVRDEQGNPVNQKARLRPATMRAMAVLLAEFG